MSEEFRKPPIESGSRKRFTPSPLTDLLPRINATGLEPDVDFESLGAQAKENIVTAFEAGRMNYAAKIETTFAVYLLRELLELRDSDPEAFERIKSNVLGKTVIDLAAGANKYGYEVASILESAAYVGVEAYNANRLSDTILHTVSEARALKNQKRMPYTIVAEDILKFLMRLPDKMQGIAFISSGTDRNVFQDFQYNEQVVREMERTLAPGGAAIFFESAFPIDLDEENMDISRLGESRSLVYAVKK